MKIQAPKISEGSPIPFGATVQGKGINFALASKHASSVTLLLFDLVTNQLLAEFPLDPQKNKTGDVWHLFVEIEPNSSLGYAYRIEAPAQNSQHYFDSSKKILDPYAKAVNSSHTWSARSCGDLNAYQPIGLVSPFTDFDWENDKPIHIPEKDLIIYEMHVRSFTQHSSSSVKAPGTFLGIIEKIPHLLELGVNAIELMPITEFNECEYRSHNPNIQENLYQFWGYSPVNFFAPMNRYASNGQPGAAIQEFKQMVKALHQNGIAVILDIVLNHTNESKDTGALNSYKGIDSCVYYITDSSGKFLDFTGCGNTFNTNEPLVQDLIIDVLRYWVLEMHVDGFRFDLASIFYRGKGGEVLSRAPIVEVISKDPVLSKTLLIAEPWDAAGLYQVGSFYPHDKRWSEWNARYRDAVRQFIKGDSNLKGKIASCFSGSQDMYGSKSPISSINFIISHDGFSLYDLVSYNQKHNLSNGENNQDGLNNNDSWNCGKEGPTDDPPINALRERQMRNFHLALMISQGIPMLLMGDEYAHTRKGNNNTWCHDNELNWFLWDRLKQNTGFYRYYRKLIEFRKKNPILHGGRFLTDQDVTWLNMRAQPVLWDKEPHFLAFTLLDKGQHKELYCAFNAQNAEIEIQLPEPNDHQSWHFVVDTGNPSPKDFYEAGERPVVSQNSLKMIPFSALLLERDFS
jgi:isoamylase